MKIVYVHGRAQQGKAATLKDEWDSILREGLRVAGLTWPKEVTSVAPFYGDELAKRTAQADQGDIFGLVRKGSTPELDAAKLAFYRDFLKEIAARRDIEEGGLLDEDGRPVQKGFLNWRPVNALLRELNKIRSVADLSMEDFTRDVFYYLQYASIRDFIDPIVDREIPTGERCIVVSHSLGTVVSYNVLIHREDVDNVQTWITLGSPLGIQAVFDRLPSGGGKRIAPWGIASWYNARDPQDVVALNPILAANFSGTPEVENASHVVNRTSNQHGISGYLGDLEVVRRIYAAVI